MRQPEVVCSLVLDQLLQSAERVVPLARDLLEAASRGRQPVRLQFPHAVAAAADRGPSAPRRATKPMRVSSPSAANTAADACKAAPPRLRRADMPLDVLHL